jgi:hypothetical protein
MTAGAELALRVLNTLGPNTAAGRWEKTAEIAKSAKK